MAQRESPKFTGVTIHRDRLGRYAVRYPTGWQQTPVEGRDGVMFLPNPNDSETSLSVWVEQLEHRAVAEDLHSLAEGVAEGLARLDGCLVEESSDVVIDNLIKFDRVFTFRAGGALRKRRAWLLYADEWLIVLTWQASSPDEYAHWEAMANYSFATFEIPPALMFATDREVAGRRPAAPRSGRRDRSP